MISESEAVRLMARALSGSTGLFPEEERRLLREFGESPAPAPVQSGVCPDCGWKFHAKEGVYAGHLCPKCGTPLGPEKPAPATVTVEGLEKAMAIELGCCPNTVSFDGLSPNWRVISEVCARVALNLLGEVRRG